MGGYLVHTLVPVCGDGRASRDSSSELESARGTVIVASNRGRCSVGDRVAVRAVNEE